MVLGMMWKLLYLLTTTADQNAKNITKKKNVMIGCKKSAGIEPRQ